MAGIEDWECTPVTRLMTVLIVDDTPADRQVLEQALREKYAIRFACNGPSALLMLQEMDKPDIILLDAVMPEMDGYEVCRRIKRDPATRDIPVIFVTFMDQVHDQQLGFGVGAVDYITKPFLVPLVIARVDLQIQLKQKSEALEKLSLIDVLTDILNRRGLEQALAKEWARARRSGSPISVLMIDVDFFKSFNDHDGHAAGDDCLRRVARQLARGLERPGDFIGRYGGDEFMAILPDCNGAGVAVVAEHLRARVAALQIAHPHSAAAKHVTVSIGYTTRTVRREGTWLELMEEADKALYQAKSGGRNRACAQQESGHP